MFLMSTHKINHVSSFYMFMWDASNEYQHDKHWMLLEVSQWYASNEYLHDKCIYIINHVSAF